MIVYKHIRNAAQSSTSQVKTSKNVISSWVAGSVYPARSWTEGARRYGARYLLHAIKKKFWQLPVRGYPTGTGDHRLF